jgi:hypothetical protein
MLNALTNVKLNLNHPGTKEIAQCTNCQRYGHTKNYCHRKDRSSTVRCVLCDGNHPANYKGCTVYKDLQKKTYPLLRIIQYTPSALIQQTIHTQPGVSHTQITPKNPSTTPTPAPVPPANQPQQQSNDISELKALLKNLFNQMGTLLNLLTIVLTKLK